MTGFPGFLGSALLPRILQRTGGEAVCLVQRRFLAAANRRLAELDSDDPSLRQRIRIIGGESPSQASASTGTFWPRSPRRGISPRCTT
jgi:thioester reductase-like protein